LGCLAGVYRSTPQRSTGATSNLLGTGRETRPPPELQFPTVHQGSDVSVGQLVSDVWHSMLRAHKVARQQLASYSKGRNDSNVLLHHYVPGDLLWFMHEVRKPGVNPKLERAYDRLLLSGSRTPTMKFNMKANPESSITTS